MQVLSFPDVIQYTNRCLEIIALDGHKCSVTLGRIKPEALLGAHTTSTDLLTNCQGLNVADKIVCVILGCRMQGFLSNVVGAPGVVDTV